MIAEIAIFSNLGGKLKNFKICPEKRIAAITKISPITI